MFFPGTFHSWLDLLYSDWKSSLKRKSTFTIPTITRSGKAKKETSKSESCEAQTVQTNAMVLPTSTYLHIVIPFNWNVKVIVRQETTGFISTGFYFLQPQACFRDTNIYIQVGRALAPNVTQQHAFSCPQQAGQELTRTSHLFPFVLQINGRLLKVFLIHLEKISKTM